MQIYADLRILTARPTPEEEAAAPHHLFGVADAADAWSVGRWLRAASAALDEIAARGRPAIVVGGTGLYFRALIGGLAEIPSVPPDVRAASQALFDEIGEAAFRDRLRTVDPAAAARIASGDRQRLTRAYEVWTGSGRALTDWQHPTVAPLRSGTWRGLILEPPREALYARCDARLEAMLATGALEEVTQLTSQNLAPGLPAMKALGFAPFAAQLRGALTPDQALAQARQDTRNYAKRQLTWFRNQTPDWRRVDWAA